MLIYNLQKIKEKSLNILQERRNQTECNGSAFRQYSQLHSIVLPQI